MKLFYTKSYYNPEYHKELFPLLRNIIKKNDFSKINSSKVYKISGKDFFVVPNIEQADVVILTMSWNYFINTNNEELAIDFIHNCNSKHKLVWISILGDVGLKIPYFKNVKIFRMSGYKSRLPKNHFGLPVFITDPRNYSFIKVKVNIPKYTNKPIVGFCGLAEGNKYVMFKHFIKILIKNVLYYLKLSKNTPNTFVIGSYIRFQCLNKLKLSNQIMTNFLIRKKYRAGAQTNFDRNLTTQDFFNNIINSQYILCARGAGNFSTRLYETLAMGRIPVYLHTDDLLPLADDIDWKRHLVWVDWHERNNIAEKVIDFHNKLNDESLNFLAQKNRLLWESKLQIGTFFSSKKLHNDLPESEAQ